jgi:hypothetical protein
MEMRREMEVIAERTCNRKHDALRPYSCELHPLLLEICACLQWLWEAKGKGPCAHFFAFLLSELVEDAAPDSLSRDALATLPDSDAESESSLEPELLLSPSSLHACVRVRSGVMR